MDVTGTQSHANSPTLSTPATNTPAGLASSASTTDNRADRLDPKSAALDSYIAALEQGGSLTILYTLEQNAALKVTKLGDASSADLVSDLNDPNVRYNPAVVNLDPTQPAGTPVVHTINWGGYGSPQAKPEPTQIVSDASTPAAPAAHWSEVLILPAADAPQQQAASGSSETVYRPGIDIKLGPILVASRAGLHASTDPFEAANVEVRSGWQSIPRASSTPSTSNPTPPVSNTVVIDAAPATQGSVTVEHVPIVNSDNASIVTIDPNGTETIDENSASTTAADLSKYAQGFLRGVTIGANGTVIVYSGGVASAQRAAWATNTLDVTG